MQNKQEFFKTIIATVVFSYIVYGGCSGGGPPVPPVAPCDQCSSGETITIQVQLPPSCTNLSGVAGGGTASVEFHGFTSSGADTTYAGDTTNSSGQCTITAPCDKITLVQAIVTLPDPTCPAGKKMLYEGTEAVPALSTSSGCAETVPLCLHKTGQCIS